MVPLQRMHIIIIGAESAFEPRLIDTREGSDQICQMSSHLSHYYSGTGSSKQVKRK